MLRTSFFSFVLFHVIISLMFSQYPENTGNEYSVIRETAGISEIYDSLFIDLQLIDGRLHSAKYPSGTNHAFFLNGEPVPGKIMINGKEYTHPYIRYDLLNDMLQIYHFSRSGTHIIDLNKEKVEAFSISGHNFEHISVAKYPGFSFNEGFYEVMYGGKYTYWLHREKIFMSKTIETTGGYETVLSRYISGPLGWFRITNQKSLLTALPEKKDELKEFLRKSHITIKLATDEEITGIIKFYESITVKN